MLVRDLMSRDPLVLAPDETLDVAEMFMSLAHIRHLPVTDGGRVVGLVTHRDLLRACARLVAAEPSLPGNDLAEAKKTVVVAEIMQSDVRTVDVKCGVRQAIDLMIDHKFGCLPVTEHNRLVGIITEADFLKLARRLVTERGDR